MSQIYADRVKETTTTTGTGTLTLAGALTAFQSFNAGVGNGNTCDYCILGGNGTDWEVGNGTFTAAGTTLSRDTVYASSNSGSKITLSGTSTVFLTMSAHLIAHTYGASITKTSGYAVLANDNLAEFDNIGAGGGVTLSLPAAAVDLEYGFLVDAAQTLTVAANGTDVIHAAGLASTAGGNFSSSVQYSYLHLRAHSTGRWITTSMIGAWTAA